MTRPLSPKVSLLLAALLGAGSVLSFAPFDLFPLVWLTLAGLFWQLRAAPTVRFASAIGFVFGLGWFGLGTSWVYVSLSMFGGLPPPIAAVATILFCAVLALFPALVAGLFARCRGKCADSILADTVLFAALWMLAEWSRGWFLTGFPWLALGYSQVSPSPLAGYAPVFGVLGVSFVTVWFAALLVAAGAARSVRLLPALVGLALLGIGQGLAGISWTQPQGDPIKVALLQGNVPQDLKWRPEKLTDSLSIYGALMREHPATLTVLPETAIPTFLSQLPRPYLESLLDHAQAQQGDVLFGIAAGDGQNYANAAVSIGVSPTQLYYKSHLVPFGEFVPPGFGWFLDMMQIPMSSFTPGPDRQPPMEIAGQKIAINICYEDVFGGEIIRALPQATILVNLSNTAWFGDSLAQPQHLQIARMRALETGRPMLRATNTGMTAVVGADGKVQAVLPPFTRDALVAEVQGFSGSTPYVRWGNGGAILVALLLLAVLIASKRRLGRT